MKFIDLFAGMGGFHRALVELGHECVFASEIDQELQELYRRNFPSMRKRVFGDIRDPAVKRVIPPHQVLCAGFPCQPFSKSGKQAGWEDQTRGTLFHDIMEVLAKHKPRFVILENVGNFERHNDGRTWEIVRESLEEIGYCVRGTEHKTSGGHGLVSPHQLRYPHRRERFFIVCSLDSLPDDPFPRFRSGPSVELEDLITPRRDLPRGEALECALTEQQVSCIDHWNSLLRALPGYFGLPSFPIWADEADATYPFEDSTPYELSLAELRQHCRTNGRARSLTRPELLALFPHYAQQPVSHFPPWKRAFIRQNREWFSSIREHLPARWLIRLKEFPHSLRKLEWNCKGEPRDLWRYVLQFRPSGLRVKRYDSIPALVAMTTTQIPILGPERRFITRAEGLRFQGFPESHRLPESREAAFAALGNGVHVGVAKAVAKRLFAS